MRGAQLILKGAGTSPARGIRLWIIPTRERVMGVFVNYLLFPKNIIITAHEHQ